jgi:O-acetyl-ADP-ribose deacetylase (regulator of RNase III)
MNRESARMELPGGRTLVSVLGDITVESVDAIVNAANTRLRHGGGVAGAISRKGGPAIQNESDRIAPVPTGSAKATSGGELPARYVIHAVGPVWGGGKGGEEALLARAVTSALDVATRLNLTRISLPTISAGVFGFPAPHAVRTIRNAIAEYCRNHPDSTLREIRVCNIDPTMTALWDEALKAG